MESCKAAMTNGTNLHDDESDDYPKQLYKSTSCLVLTNVNHDFSKKMFRRRKRSIVDCESGSDESVEKWAKMDYDSESCSDDVGYHNDFQNFSEGQSPGCRWRNKGPVGMSYSLRPRTGLRKCWSEGDVDSSRRGTKKTNRCRAATRVTLSKYRRNTANARERERMKEINTAFSALRGVLPAFATSQMPSMTKITTLQLASSYIRALSDMLNEPVNHNEHEDESTDDENFCSRRPGVQGRGSMDDRFNNNTSLPNRNLQPDGPYRLQQVNLAHNLGAGTTARQPSAPMLFPEHPVGDAWVRNSGERSGGGCDDTLQDDYLLAWGDLAPLQNFHWDSN